MERCITSNSCDDEQKERMNNVEESLSAKSEGTGNGNFENSNHEIIASDMSYDDSNCN